MINNAHGPLFVFGLVASSLEESLAVCAEVAERHGVVLYDTNVLEVVVPRGLKPVVAAGSSDQKRRWFRRR